MSNLTNHLLHFLGTVAHSQLLGVLVGSWITLYVTRSADRRTRKRAAQQAAWIVYDEMGLLLEALMPLTEVACLDSAGDEFVRRFEYSTAVWREWRQHLIPDAIAGVPRERPCL